MKKSKLELDLEKINLLHQIFEDIMEEGTDVLFPN